MTARWLSARPPAEQRPLHVQLEVTWRCNWRCVHCYQDNHDVEELTDADLDSLFPQLVLAGTLHLIVTGGEPLVRVGILEVLESARRHGLGITLYTNAHRITQVIAARLARSVAVAEVSVLAGSANVHDQLCGVRGAFERTWAGVRHLLDAGVDVLIKTPLLAPAFDTLDALYARVNDAGLDWNPDPDITQSYARGTFPTAYRLSAAQTASFYETFPRYRPRAGARSNDPGAPNGVCLAGRQYAFIDARGNVYPCLSFKAASDLREQLGEPHLRLGNIRTQRFSDLWVGNEMLGEVRRASSATFRRCADCTGTCSPCMAANLEEHGHLFEPATVRCTVGRAARALPMVR
ncbi:MAG TPA: radical SAM protein [Kofleriaceae bacterium]|nr:radical SAM protein [Kofleriaceae bacterium]